MNSSNPVLNRYNRRGYASMGNSNVGTTGFNTSYDAQEGGQLEDLYIAPAASSMLKPFPPRVCRSAAAVAPLA